MATTMKKAIKRKFSKCMINLLSNKKVLKVETINENVVKMPLALKSKVMLHADKIKKEINSGVKKPFNKITNANIGDPQGMGQSPLTFLRQVLALCIYPKLINEMNCAEDVKNRAKFILSHCKCGSIGSVTDPHGVLAIREHISEYCTARDNGVISDPDDIFIVNGCAMIEHFFNLIGTEINGKPIGLMIPIPTYPMYHALLTVHKIQPINYYLSEENQWSLDLEELKNVINKSRSVCHPKGIVIINPGNPTGQVLKRRNIEEIIKFCYDENLIIIADEVYQQNINDKNVEFHSIKKIKYELGYPYSEIELLSIYSASKGYIGECGFRGGYFEFDKIDDKVKKLFSKILSIHKCPNTTGQIALEILVNPPKCGDPSYEKFIKEKKSILNNYAMKSDFIYNKLNSIEGVRVNPLQGGIFAYAKIRMPKKAIREAENLKIDPSLMWCLKLLDKTGIALVPGCSFLQEKCTYHFRITIVPPIDVLDRIIKGIEYFHKDFLKAYE